VESDGGGGRTGLTGRLATPEVVVATFVQGVRRSFQQTKPKMSILDFFTGNAHNYDEVYHQDIDHLQSEKSELERRVASLTSENDQLRAHVDEAKALLINRTRDMPEVEEMEKQIGSLQKAHEEALQRVDEEHKERLKLETEKNEALLQLQKAQYEAQHAKNSNAILEQRADLSAKNAEEASESALKIESEKDSEIVANEKQIGDLITKLNRMKVEQLALKRDLASCASSTQEAHGNLNSIHGFSKDVVSEFESSNSRN